MITNPDTPTQPLRQISDGYRQGIITAVTVFLGFSLAFLRYWVFEAPGDWTLQSVVVAAALVIAVLIEIYALFRALRLSDNNEREYGRTVNWFIASAAILFLGLLLAALVLTIAPDPV